MIGELSSVQGAFRTEDAAHATEAVRHELHATTSLYPGYGLDEAEELRQQTLALLASFIGY
jgi:hypothetical protein